VLTSAGAVEVTVPRVNDRRTDPDTGERSSASLPPWARKTPKVTEVLPLLYLHGLSTGDFVPVLGQFLGSGAGLSPAVITRLTEQWQAEQRTFAARDLSQVDYAPSSGTASATGPSAAARHGPDAADGGRGPQSCRAPALRGSHWSRMVYGRERCRSGLRQQA
jgi:Transposase, Mutator family